MCPRVYLFLIIISKPIKQTTVSNGKDRFGPGRYVRTLHGNNYDRVQYIYLLIYILFSILFFNVYLCCVRLSVCLCTHIIHSLYNCTLFIYVYALLLSYYDLG